MILDINGGDRSNHLIVLYSNPKVSISLLINFRNVEQIRLVFQRNWQSKFLTLNVQN